MSKVDHFQQEQKHLIESLDNYYDKWSNSDFSQVIDRLSNIAKDLIEENQKIDSTAKLLKKKMQQLSIIKMMIMMKKKMIQIIMTKQKLILYLLLNLAIQLDYIKRKLNI